MSKKARMLASTLVVSGVAPASADEKKPVFALAYSFVAYLEEDGGSSSLGVTFSAATAAEGVGLEADFAYHQDSHAGIVLNTYTAGFGPRWGKEGAKASPFVHALGLLRYDAIEGESNTAFGTMIGAGVDLGRGTRFRLGADFQIVFDEGENFKSLRLTAGVRF